MCAHPNNSGLGHSLFLVDVSFSVCSVSTSVSRQHRRQEFRRFYLCFQRGNQYFLIQGAMPSTDSTWQIKGKLILFNNCFSVILSVSSIFLLSSYLRVPPKRERQILPNAVLQNLPINNGKGRYHGIVQYLILRFHFVASSPSPSRRGYDVE